MFLVFSLVRYGKEREHFLTFIAYCLRIDISSVPPWKRVILEDNIGFLDWSLLPQNTRFIVTFFYAFLYWKRSAYIVSVEGD